MMRANYRRARSDMIDSAILEWINGFAGRSPALDGLVWLLADNALFKGAVFMAACWWLWFRRAENEEAGRRSRS